MDFDFRGAAIRTFCQIAAVVIVSAVFCLAACLVIVIASGVPFGEMFLELNSGVSPFGVVAILVLGYIGLFMMNLVLCDPSIDEWQKKREGKKWQ